MRSLLLLFFLVYSGCVFAQPLTGSYTIGGATPDYSDFTTAVSALELNGVSGPVVFNVRNGTYTESVYMTNIIGSSSANTITFQSESGDSSLVTLTYGGSANTFFGDTVRNILFRKMTFRNTANTGYNALIIRYGNNIKVQNCVIRGAGSAGGFGLSCTRCDSAIYIQNCWAYNANYSVYLSDDILPYTKDVRVENNTITSFDYALYLNDLGNTIVRYNFIQGSYRALYAEGVEVDEMHHNTMRSGGGAALIMGYCWASGTGRVRIHNNLILTTSSGQPTNYGASFYQVDQLEFVNNTIYFNSNYNYQAALKLDVLDSCFIYNNIIINNGNGYAYQLSVNVYNEYSDHNVIRTNGTQLSPGISTLAQWQAVFYLDSNSISANPQFINIPNNLHPTNPVIDGMGIPWVGITNDLSLVPRHPLYPDPGAYEFSFAPTANLGPDQTICGNSTLLSAANNGSYYLWNTGDTTQTINATSTGTYWVQINNLAGTSSDTINVTIHPLAAISISGDNSICSNDSTQLTIVSPATTFSWLPVAGLDNPDSNVVNASPFVNTTYTITVTDNFGCTNSDSISITVNSIPVAQAGSDQFICFGGQTILGTTSGMNCNWLPISALNSSTDCQPIALPTLTTNYILTVTDLNGCENSDSVLVTVNPLPTVAVCCDQTLCAGDTVSLNAITSASNLSWSPSAGLNTTTGNNVNAFPASSVTYTVAATDVNGCSFADSVTLTVNPLPAAPTITQNIGDLISSESAGNQWYLNGNLISGATGQIYAPVQNGNYSVVVTDVNGCSAASATYFFGSTGVENSLLTKANCIYSAEHHQLRFTGLMDGKYKLGIYNQLGQLIFTDEMNLSAGAYTYELEITQGVYVILLEGVAEDFRWKVNVGE